MPLSQEDFDRFDQEDRDLDDLLQDLPPPLQRRFDKKDDGDSSHIIPEKDKTAPVVLVSLQERASRLVPRHATYDHLKEVSSNDLGWHVVRKRKRRPGHTSYQYHPESYWPCRIVTQQSSNTTAMADKDEDPLVHEIQYLGFQAPKSAKLERIKRNEFLPLDYVPPLEKKTKRGRKKGSESAETRGTLTQESDTEVESLQDPKMPVTRSDNDDDDDNDDDSKPPASSSAKEMESNNDTKNNGILADSSTRLAWSPVLLRHYREALLKKYPEHMHKEPDFWNKDYQEQHSSEITDFWWQVEANFLANVIHQVQQQAVALATQETSRLVEEGGEESEDNEEDNDENQNNEAGESGSSIENADASSATNDCSTETTPLVSKLRAGDEIEYYPIHTVASKHNKCTGRIFRVRGKKKGGTCLELVGRGQLVEVGQNVSLRKRYLRGKLIAVDKKRIQAVECFDLDLSMNGKVDFLRQPKPSCSLLAKTIADDACAKTFGANNKQDGENSSYVSSRRTAPLGRAVPSPKTEPRRPALKKAATGVKRGRPTDENKASQCRRSMRIRLQA